MCRRSCQRARVLLDLPLVTTDQVGSSLQATPLLEIDEMRAALDAAPAVGGFYAWWIIKPEALPRVRVTPHPSEPVGLLYVGIGPTRGSSRPLRKRFADHTKRNTGNSTFRLALASFLFESVGWHPYWSDRPMLPPEENRELSTWQAVNLRVQWVEVAQPWRIEGDVVRLLRPPFNREHNRSHHFYADVGRARDAYRAAARSNRASEHGSRRQLR